MIVTVRGQRRVVSTRRLLTAACIVLAGLFLSVGALTNDGGPVAFFNLEPAIERAAVAVGLHDGTEGIEAARTPREWVVEKDRWKDGHFWSGQNWIYGIAAILLGLVASAAALFMARKFYNDVKAAAPGNEKMQEIAGAVRDGAMAYLARQRKVVLPVLAATAVVIAAINLLGAHWWLSIFVLFGLASGGLCSFATGWFGMRTATMASNRTAWACKEGGLNAGLQVAFKAGAVMGLSVVGIGLAFVTVWLLIMAGVVEPIAHKAGVFTFNDVANAMITFGLGASLVALFARVGGGIFTKAADVGADLVGKVEAGIPEDDPRNPATIADNVGDNVGDVAGMGADLYESYVGSMLAALALAWSAAYALGKNPFGFVFAALGIAAVGIGLSVFSTRFVKTKEGATLSELLHALHKGVNMASIGVGVLALPICLLAFPWVMGVMMWLAVVVGLVAGLVIAWGSERYTAYDYEPTQSIAKQAVTGPATVIIGGLAVGMMSTWIPIITVAVATLLAFGFGGGFATPEAGLFAVALAAVGMLSTLGITLATDAYGPIADNAGGNAEMAGLPPEVREKTDALDSLGNTTAAIGKGFAIGSAALTALALIASYSDSIKSFIIAKKDVMFDGSTLGITSPSVIIGLFIGAMLVFIFGALTMKAVGDAAKDMVEEVRRQFREIPGIMEGTGKPDYARCVDISTSAAIRKMIVPSVIAVAGPILTGVLFGAGAVFGLLAGGLATGFAMAVMMANAGGAWDNAKKWIEKGGLAEAFIAEGKYNPEAEGEKIGEGKTKYARYMKGSPEHKAAVTGDTVGDPFKDTSGPSMNILVKLMSMVAVATVALVMVVNDGNGILPLLFELVFTSGK